MACAPSCFRAIIRGPPYAGGASLVHHKNTALTGGRSVASRRTLTDRASGPGGKFGSVRGIGNACGHQRRTSW